MWCWWVFRLWKLYRKKLVDKLVEECTETVEAVRQAKITWVEYENKHKNKCSSCILCIVLFSIIFAINIGIGTYFLYFYWYLKKDVTRIKFGTCTQTAIYWTCKWDIYNSTN